MNYTRYSVEPKKFDDLDQADKVVIGSGPEYMDSALLAKREFEFQIAAAGGIDA